MNISTAKYWSPGCLEDVPLQLPQDIPLRSYLTVQGTPQSDVWGRSEMTSKGLAKLTFKGRHWEIDLVRSQDVLRTSTKRTFRVLKLDFSFRTYSIDQIYLKAFQHSRCNENPVKLLRWSILWKTI